MQVPPKRGTPKALRNNGAEAVGDISTVEGAHIATSRADSQGRSIVVTEDPKLHQVWIYDRIYLKQLFKYLLSHNFWEVVLLGSPSLLGEERDCILRAALGYIRTYGHLIKHESEFSVAQEKTLIPSATWKEFCDFSATFDTTKDAEVSGRYPFGELRLTSLNFYSKIFFRKWAFQRVYTQYRTYFSRF
jgi:hypothetical protein